MTAKIILLGVFCVTSYRATPSQTRPETLDNNHCFTSIGQPCNELGVAVSPDVLKSHRLKYGDIVCIEGIGCRTVFDTMNARNRNALDLFVLTKAQEKEMGTRYLKAWKLEVK